jgi:hypothetical protein
VVLFYLDFCRGSAIIAGALVTQALVLNYVSMRACFPSYDVWYSESSSVYYYIIRIIIPVNLRHDVVESLNIHQLGMNKFKMASERYPPI